MVSIIIPTLNAAPYLKKFFIALRDQTVQPGEIMIIDSSSEDGTSDIARSLGAKVITIDREDFDHSHTRNMAGKEAKGDLLIYMTQDALPVNRFALSNLLRPLEDATVAAAYGRQIPYPGAFPFAIHLRVFNYPAVSCVKSLEDKERYGIKTAFLSNSFAVYRKSALDEIGWFRENLISIEDTCAGAQFLMAGYKLAYAANAMVFHSHNYSAVQELKRYFDIGVFHKQEYWIVKEFGMAEGEGIRYLQSEASFLIGSRKYYLLPNAIMRNLLKYVGYLLGKYNEKLPRPLIKKISMHKDWWDKKTSVSVSD